MNTSANEGSNYSVSGKAYFCTQNCNKLKNVCPFCVPLSSSIFIFHFLPLKFSPALVWTHTISFTFLKIINYEQKYLKSLWYWSRITFILLTKHSLSLIYFNSNCWIIKAGDPLMLCQYLPCCWNTSSDGGAAASFELAPCLPWNCLERIINFRWAWRDSLCMFELVRGKMSSKQNRQCLQNIECSSATKKTQNKTEIHIRNLSYLLTWALK